MRFDLSLCIAAILVSVIPADSAAAQTPAPATGQDSDASWVAPGGVSGSFYDNSGASPGTPTTPERLSDGTLAESANTTALASSTYHQPTGFLPGMKP
ncbi:MAG TPA: hypothetical protein VHC39_02995 [Rhizomicrobium sp.]|nr:hypothetical protein [Rhizomicrobium sp.]